MAEKAEQSLFAKLYAIDVSEKLDKKNGLTYLSWPSAWAEIKKVVPDATYTVYERETPTGPVNYFSDGKTCWVKTGVTLNGLEHIEMLPVMDFRNNSIPLENITSTAVNKAIQRSITKAAARHGLGLFIYEGEDLPEDASEGRKREKEEFDRKKQEIESEKLATLDEQIKKGADRKSPPATVEKAEEVPW